MQPWEELAMIGLHYGWYLGMVFSFLPIWKGLLFVVLSQVRSLGRQTVRGGCWQDMDEHRFYILPDEIHDSASMHVLQVFSGFLLSIVFVQSHNGMEVYCDTKDFVTAQIVSTRDITAGLWNDWFTGTKRACVAAF